MLGVFSMLIGVAWAGWPSLEPPPEVGGGERDAALVVGIESYFAVPPVTGARQNARDWVTWFREARGTPPERVVLLLDAEATVETLTLQAGRLAESLDPDGVLWVVFVGHGAPDPGGTDVRLLGVDAQANPISLTSRGVSREALVSATAEAGDRRVFVVDACFSGRAPDGSVLVPGLQPIVPSHALVPGAGTWLTASRSDQVAGPLPGEPRPAFSYLVLGALQGWGDRDADGNVTASEAVGYAEDTLRGTVLDRVQRPRLDGADRVLAPVGDRAAPDLGAVRRTGRPTAPTPPPTPSAVPPVSDARFDAAYWAAVAAAEDPHTDTWDIEHQWCALAALDPEANPYREVAGASCQAWTQYRADHEALWSGFRSEYASVRDLLRLDAAPAPQKAQALARLDAAYGAVHPWMGRRIDQARAALDRRGDAALPAFAEPPTWAQRVAHQPFRWGWDPVLKHHGVLAVRLGGGIASDGQPVVDMQPAMAIQWHWLDLSLLNVTVVGGAPTFGFAAGVAPFVVRPSRRDPGEARGSVLNPIVGIGARMGSRRPLDPDASTELALTYPELYVANHVFVTNGVGVRLEGRRPVGAGAPLPAVAVASLVLGFAP